MANLRPNAEAMEFTAAAESTTSNKRLSAFLIWAIVGVLLAVITMGLYAIANQKDTAWAWLPTVALGFLLPVSLAAYYWGLGSSLVVAAISTLAVVPILLKKWSLWTSGTSGVASGALTGLVAVMLVVFIAAVALGELFARQRRQNKRYKQTAAALNERIKELSAIEEVDRALGATLDTQQVIDLVLEHAVRAVNATAGMIGTLSANNQALEMRAARGLDVHWQEMLLSEPWPVTQGIMGRAVNSGQVVLVSDVARDADYVTWAADVRSELAVPLKSGGYVIGILDLESAQENAFDENTLRFVQHLAEHAVIALSKAQIHAVSEERSREAQELYNIATLASSTLNMEDLLNKIVTHLAEFLQAEKGVVLVLDPVTQTLVPHPAGIYGGPPDLPHIRIVLTEEIKAGSLYKGQPFTSNDATRDPRVPKPYRPLVSSFDVKTLLSAPLRLGDQYIGEIHFCNKKQGHFTDNDVRLMETIASHFTVAIVNAQIYQLTDRQLRNRVDELTALQRVSTRLNTTLNLDQAKSLPEMIRLTAQAISEGVGFQAVLISLTEGEPPMLRRMAAVGVPDDVFERMQQVRPPLALIEDLMRDEFRIGQSYLIPHQHKAVWQGSIDAYTFSDNGQEQGWHPEDVLLVPMYGIGQTILGIIAVDRPADGRIPDQSVVETLQVFAQQAATAIENARLYNDLHRYVENLTLINEFGQAIISGLEPENIFQEVVTASTELLHCPYSALCLWDRGSEKLNIKAARGFPSEGPACFPESICSILAESVIKQGRAMLVADTEADARFSRLAMPPTNIHALVAVPLVEGRAAGGLLIACAAESAAFSRTDQVLLSTLADQASVAIQNATLYSGITQRARELETLNDIGKTVISSLDMDTTLSLIMAKVGEAFRVEAGSLFLLDGDLLRLETAFGPASEKIRGLVLELGQGIVGWVAKTGDSAMVLDAKLDERHFASIDQTSAYQTRSLICAPMKGPDNQVIGVLELLNPMDGGLFTQHDMELLESVTTFAVVAIQNANLFSQRERKIVELNILNEIGQALSSTLQQDELMELIHYQVARVMPADNFFVALYNSEHDLVSFPIVYEGGRMMTGPGIETPPPDYLPRRGRQGLTEYIIESGQVVWLPNRFGERLEELEIELIGSEALSWLGVPILSGDHALGVIAVQSYEQENAYDEDHRDLLKTIAGHASVAIRNARLFDQINRITQNLELLIAERTEELAQANRDLMVQRDRLNALYQITRELSSSLEPDRMLNRALALINHALDVQHGYILLQDAEVGDLVYKAVISEQGLSMRGELIRAAQPGKVPVQGTRGLIDWLMSHHEAVCVGDLSEETRWFPQDEWEQQYYSVLATQLLSSDDVVGALVLYHREKDHFTSEHQQMIDAIASQLGIMVSNTEMFRLLREATGRLGNMLLTEQLEAAKSQAILEGVADGVMVMDAKGQVTLFNAAAEHILQTPRDEVIGRQAAEMSGFYNLTGTSWSELAERWAGQSFSGREGSSIEPAYEERFEVQEQVVSMRVAPVIRQGAFEGTVAVFRDITKDVEVDRLKSEFVSMVSHELRTPMTSIKGYIDLLYNEMAGPLSDAQKRFLQIVKGNADRLTSLVNDLLDISRIDTGRVSLSIQPTNPVMVINTVITNLLPNARTKDQRLRSLIQGPLPFVRADPARMTQILTNLTANAINYTPTGGEVTIDAQITQDMLIVQVVDNGIGISEEDQKKLFTRFFRADNELVQASSGTGLGLSIAKSLVDLHGGKLWFESELGGGTTFSFSVPLSEATAEVAPRHEFRTISYRAEDKHILVVEDEIEVADQIAHQLQSQGGYRIHVAHTGREAIDYLAGKDRHVDLITLDLRLPDMDGFKVLEKIKSDKSLSTIPVVIVSILSPQRDDQLLGAQAYIPKPIEDGQLLTVINRILTKQSRVLVVEDDRQLSDMLREALEQSGFSVLVEYSGRQAFKTAKEEKPGLVLLDIKLPGMDGYQVLNQLKSAPETKDIPVIMVSGSVSNLEDKRRRVLKMGAAQFLAKPLSIEDLIVKIKETVGQNAVATPSN